MKPLARLSAIAVPACLLISSCDKLPFFGTSNKQASKAEQETASARTHVAGKPVPNSAQPEVGAELPEPAEKAGYTLYISPQPVPVGSVMLTTGKEVLKSKTSYDACDGKAPVVTNSVTTTTKVHGIMVDSERQLTLLIKRDDKKTSPGNRQTSGPLNGHTAIVVKGQEGRWKGAIKNGKTTALMKRAGTSRGWKGAIKNGKTTADQQAALDEITRELNEPDDAVLLGTAPRKVGESWSIDPAILPSFRKPGYHVQPGGSVKVTFVSVTEHAGHKYALIESVIDVYILITDPDVTDTTKEGVVKATLMVKGTSKSYRSLVYGMALSKQNNLRVVNKRVVPNENGYGVSTSTGTLSENTVTELELKSHAGK